MAFCLANRTPSALLPSHPSALLRRRPSNRNHIETMKTILAWLTRLQSNQIAPVIVSATGGTIPREQALRHVYVSNAGASATTTFLLPKAEPGLRVTAIVEASTRVLRLRPAAGETVVIPSTGVQHTVAAKGIEADALAESLTLVCITKGTWDSAGYLGTWTAES